MHIPFIQELMERTAFPREAKTFLADSLSRIRASGREAELDELVNRYFASGHDTKAMEGELALRAPGFSLSPYTLWLLILMESAQRVQEPYRAQGMPEEVYWDTFSDLRCKAIECMAVKGVWGTFVAHWYPRFFRGEIVKLGRLEFERHPFPEGHSCTVGGITVRPGDPVFSIHIPSSGEPFDGAARMASYRRAYEYFREELQEGLLIGFCHSWLLYPPYQGILPPSSNIRAFSGDFTILEEETTETFEDAWRVFAAHAGKAAEELPADTTLRRVFRAHIASGGPYGCGLGLLAFDGERLRYPD